MERTMLNTNTKLAAARFAATRRAPYFTAAIMGLVPREAPGFGTFAVSEDMVMIYDPAVVQAWSVNQIATVVEHEVYHVVRDHAGRARDLGLTTPEQRKMWNIAADAESNDDLRGAGREFPCEPVYPETLTNFGVDPARCVPGLLAEEYYAMLVDAQGSGDGEDGDESPEGAEADGPEGAEADENGEDEDGGGAGAGSGEEGESGSESRVGGGDCGGCAGNPSAEEEALCEDEDGDGLGRNDVDLARMRQQVAAEVERTGGSSGCGGAPGGLLRWAEKRRKSAVKWQDKLRRAARRALKRTKGFGDYTYNRPHRRYAAMRRRNARTPILPSTYRPLPSVAVALDTSASMGTNEVEAAIAEVEGVLKHNGSAVTFLACDSKVRTHEKITTAKQAAKLVVGGGGTRFAPVFDALEKDKDRPDIIVFVTDGYAYDAPESAPKWAHVIWVLVGPCVRKPAPWGEHIRVKEAA